MKVSSITHKLVLGAALATSVAGCSGEEVSTAAEAEEIIGGVPARSAKLNAVGTLANNWGDGTYNPFCTATLIAPTVVLTAEQCLQQIYSGYTHFTVGPDARFPLRAVAVSQWLGETSVFGGYLGLGSDIGVVHLAEAINDVSPLPYAELTDDQIGRRFVGLGYGYQDSNGTMGSRRAGSMTYQGSSGNPFDLLFGSFDGFLAEVVPAIWPGLPVNDWYYQTYYFRPYYDSHTLLSGFEALFGGGVGDAQTCSYDFGGPITAQRSGATTVFGVASWTNHTSDGVHAVCDFGTAYASINPTSKDFLDYEVACHGIPQAGVCEGGVAVRCSRQGEGPRRQLRTDCGEIGHLCGLDEATGEIGCLPDPCFGLTTEGACEGDVVARCSRPGEGERRPLRTDCSELFQTCGTDPDTGELGCVEAL